MIMCGNTVSVVWGAAFSKVNEDNTSARRVTVRETRNTRYTFYNANDDIIIVPETRYRIDMTVVNANVRAAETCSIHVSTNRVRYAIGSQVW